MPDGRDKPAEVVFDDENPEWTVADFARARGPEELPAAVLAAFPKTRADASAADRQRTHR